MRGSRNRTLCIRTTLALFLKSIYIFHLRACAVAVAGATRVLNCRGIYTILNPPSLPPQCPLSLGGITWYYRHASSSPSRLICHVN